MARTCLIISCQLSAADLQDVQINLERLIAAQNKYRWLPKELDNNVIPYYNGMINNLAEIISKCKEKDFKFNLYILKMVIVKADLILHEIQLLNEYDALHVISVIDKVRKELSNLLSNLLEPMY